MGTCQSCGGIIGRDCFNPQECAWITQSMNEDACYRSGQESAAVELNYLRCECNRLADELDLIRRQVRQLAHDHPDTPVSYPRDGKTYYQEIRDWAAYVLGGE